MKKHAVEITIIGGLIILLLASITLLNFLQQEESFFSTVPPSKEVIAQRNEIRRSHGIREVKPYWTFIYRQFNEDTWRDENGHLCKKIKYDKQGENILWEEDYYFSGNTYISPDRDHTSPLPECLSLFYCYRKQRFGISVSTENAKIDSIVTGLNDFLTDPDDEGIGYGYMGRDDEETLAAVDKILKMWGIKRQ